MCFPSKPIYSVHLVYCCFPTNICSQSDIHTYNGYRCSPGGGGIAQKDSLSLRGLPPPTFLQRRSVRALFTFFRKKGVIEQSCFPPSTASSYLSRILCTHEILRSIFIVRISYVYLYPFVSGAPNPHETSGEDLRAARAVGGGDRGDPGGVQPLRHGRVGHDRPQGAQGGDAVLGLRGEEPDHLPDDQRYRQGGMRDDIF